MHMLAKEIVCIRIASVPGVGCVSACRMMTPTFLPF